MSVTRSDEIVVVAVGGVLGALARAAIAVAVPHGDTGSWPWATFLTNLAGCLALGLLLHWIDARGPLWRTHHPRRARLARPLLASGVLGGFTTFSTFSAETVGLVRAGAPLTAFTYVLASVVLGVVLVAAGRAVGLPLLGPVPVDLVEDEAL